jgi:hypothetical protein
MTALVVALTFVVALLAVLVVGLLRSHADLLKALHDLGVNLDDQPGERPIARSSHAPRQVASNVATPPGADVSFVDAIDLYGDLATGGAAHLAVTGVEHDTLLAFLSTGCGTCQGFWEAFAEPVRLPGRDTRLVIITNGPESESPGAVSELAPPGVVTLLSARAWDDYRVPVAPYFVLVDGPRGQVIGEGAGAGWSQVHDLLGRAAADAGVLAQEQVDRRTLARLSGQDRADWVDAQLTAAGIEPGDPSLHTAASPSDEGP